MAAARRERLLGAEEGFVLKDPGVGLNVALIFPNTYRAAMSNLGFHAVYGFINDRTDALAERAFFSGDPREDPIVDSRGRLITLESGRVLDKFHLIAFSLSFENDFPNVLSILDAAGLPLISSERTGWPMVIAGGVAAFLNPEPLAPFIDGFLLGEAEANLDPFLDIVKDAAFRGASRKETLGLLAKDVEGFYAPSGYIHRYDDRGRLTSIEPREGFPGEVAPPHPAELPEPLASRIRTPQTEFANMVLVEAGRGCPRGCRFCAAGFVYRPPRPHPWERIRDKATHETSEGDKVGLVSPAVADLENLDTLCAHLAKEGRRVSLSSLRADSLTPELARALYAGGLKSATLAPEAGTGRLRMVINKGLAEEEILAAARLLAEARVPNLKLYFMVGLPTETAEDVREIVPLVKRVLHERRKALKGRTRGLVTVSVSCFVPKPFTPFQWAGFMETARLKERLAVLRKGFRGIKGLKFTSDVPKWAYVQALLSRGDRRVGDILLSAHRSGDIKRAMSESPVNPDFFVLRERERDELFPWGIMRQGADRDFLWEEYQRGLAAQPSPGCHDPETCAACGVCE